MADVPLDVYTREIGIRERRIGELETQLNSLNGWCSALELQLSGRGSIDRAEELVFPVWLREINLERLQKWTIALKFELTPAATAIKKRLPQRIDAQNVGKVIQQLYQKWGSTYTHEKRIKLPVEENGWRELYYHLEIGSKDDKCIVKTILEEIEGDSEDEAEAATAVGITKNSSDKKTTRGFCLIENVNRNAKLNDILDFFQSVKINVEKIEHLLTSVRRSNIIVFLGNDVSRVNSIISSVPSELCIPGTTWVMKETIFENEPCSS